MLRSFLLKGGIFLAFEQYLQRGRQKLRCGYTTGACAALAAKAAAKMLLTQQMAQEETLVLPKGLAVTVPIEEAAFSPSFASCAVRKDGGDDCDATHGLLIYARVSPCAHPGVEIDGGQGVGRVTRPGLDQPVGAAAINSTPRRMIREEVEAVCRNLDYQGGLSVVISTPGGEAVAQKTFNPVLGIEGGISILGTSGVVEPQSLQALLDTIQVELKMHAAAGCKEVIFTPGNYGEDFLKAHPPVRQIPVVKISNFVGDSLDFAVEMGFTQVYLVGHLGKFVKLAAGVMNTHSRYADGRREVFAAHAGMAGANQNCICQLMEAPTADQCLAILEDAGLREPVLDSIFKQILYHTRRRADGVQVEAVVFSNQSGALAYSEEAGRLFRL
jgi:cobalt-precorrin-5B (C1)-methyltransferase